MEILRGIKPDHAARRGASRTARALRGRRLADALHVQRRNSGPRRIGRDSRQFSDRMNRFRNSLALEGSCRILGYGAHLSIAGGF